MTPGDELGAFLRGIPPRATESAPLTAGEVEVTVAPLKWDAGHLAGIDHDGHLVLLIAATGDGPAPAPIRLESLHVVCRVPCTSGPPGKRDLGRRLLVRCLATTEPVREQFLNLASSIMTALPRGTEAEYLAAFDGMIALFRALQLPSLGSVQGLWAEILVIACASDPTRALAAWRRDPEERCDFADGERRVEVKSTQRLPRIHEFALEQLVPPPPAAVLVVSVVVRQMSGGLSLLGLVERAIARVGGGPGARHRVYQTVGRTLGQGWPTALSDAFDEQLAIDSLRVYPSEAIPKPREIPPQILSMRFSVDLSSLRALPLGDQLAMGGLFAAVAPGGG